MKITGEAVELKPCPFCASRVLNQFKDDDNHIIECAQCGCEMANRIAWKAIAAWNRRQSPAGVEIKPLEWEDADEGMCTKWRAAALGGHYDLVALDGDEGGLAVNFYWGRPLSFWFIQGEPDEWGPTGPKMFPTLEEAQAAAQADYERRILSALASHEPAPDTLEPADDTLGANLGSTPEPAKDGPEVVGWTQPSQLSLPGGVGQIWVKRDMDAVRQFLDDPYCPDDIPLVRLSDYEALRAELIKSRNYWSEQCSDLNQRNAELERALDQLLDDNGPRAWDAQTDSAAALEAPAKAPALAVQRREDGGMTKPVRIQLSRKRGFNLQEHSRAINGLPAVKVDRTTRFGNPISCSCPYGCPYHPDFERYAWESEDGQISPYRCCVDAFRHYVETGMRNEPTSSGYFIFALDGLAGYPRRKKLIDALPSLRGKNLACWCALDAKCHADVLIEVANG